MTGASELFRTVTCSSFEDFVSKARKLLNLQRDRQWIFRGQKRKPHKKDGDWKWRLTSSLERACDRFGVRGGERPELECRMIREFQRRIHLYTEHVPDKKSTDEWLAIMQHYGAPTRLLDFTYSPYIAAFFAFECAEADSKVSIWAVDGTGCKEKLRGEFSKDLVKHYESYQAERKGQYFDEVFRKKPPARLVLSINPFRRNERLAYQKGVFLCPGDVTVGFMENLQGLGEDMSNHVIQFTIPTGSNGCARNKALSDLELMNINRTTLFPGLDGFAQSFSVRMITDESIKPSD